MIVLIGILVSTSGRQRPAAAQPPPRAGLVVQPADGRVIEACVELGGAERTALELIERAGLDVVADISALGAKVCAIDGTGCPASDCWCQCRDLGADCTYWAFHYLENDRWVYATRGATSHTVRPGDVNGWAWGPGGPNEGAAPPVRTFDELCAAPTLTPSPTPQPPPATGTAILPTFTPEPASDARDDDKSDTAPSATPPPRPTEARAPPQPTDTARRAAAATSAAQRATAAHATRIAAAEALDALLETAEAAGTSETAGPTASAATAVTETRPTATLARLVQRAAPTDAPQAVDEVSQNSVSSINLLGYGLFALIVMVLAGMLWLRRT